MIKNFTTTDKLMSVEKIQGRFNDNRKNDLAGYNIWFIVNGFG